MPPPPPTMHLTTPIPRPAYPPPQQQQQHQQQQHVQSHSQPPERYPPPPPPAMPLQANNGLPPQQQQQQQHDPPPKIPPNQIPRPPLFTRGGSHGPSGAACLVYTASNNNNTNSNKNSSTDTGHMSGSPRGGDSSMVDVPPAADSRFVVLDRGNANPRLLRSTLSRIPVDRATLQNCCMGQDPVPLLSLLCSPLAIASQDSFLYNDDDDNDDDNDDNDTIPPPSARNDPEAIPVISGESSSSSSSSAIVSPIRCHSCMAYLNPYCTWQDDGSGNHGGTLGWLHPSSSATHFICNFCQTRTSVSSSLSSFTAANHHTSMGGLHDHSKKSSAAPQQEDYNYDTMQILAQLRLSTMARQFGTVEYNVGEGYNTRDTMVQTTHTFCYALDCTNYTNTTGSTSTSSSTNHPLLATYIQALKQVGSALCRHFQQQQQGNNKDDKPSVRPKMGVLLYQDNWIMVPYWKVVTNEDGGAELELAVAMVMDVTEQPFCPLPLDMWTNDVSTDRVLHQWNSLLDELPNLLASVTATTGVAAAASPKKYRNNLNCGGAALAVMADALHETGGRGTLLTSHRPNFGVGGLRDRQGPDYRLYANEAKERSLFLPLQGHGDSSNHHSLPFFSKEDEVAGSFYATLGTECAQARVVMDIVVTTPSSSYRTTFLDVATLAELCRITCGKFKWLQSDAGCHKSLPCIANTHSQQLTEELLRSAVTFSGADAILKVRCSSGMQVKSFLPKVSPGVCVDNSLTMDSPELELSCVTAETCIPVILDHRVGGIPKRKDASGDSPDPMVYFQSALLYTTRWGQRRVRVTTLGIRTASTVSDVFRSADFGAITTLMTRRSIETLSTARDGGALTLARDSAVQHCTNLLASYRTRTAAKSSPSGQLILPEGLQLLPLFCMSLRKSPMFRQSMRQNASGIRTGRPSITADERAFYLHYGSLVSPAMAMAYVHPNVFDITKLHTKDGEWQTPQSQPQSHTHNASQSMQETAIMESASQPYVHLPKRTHPSISCLEDDGIYIIDDGLSLFLYIGKDCSEEARGELLEPSFVPKDSSEESSLWVLSKGSDYGQRVHNMVDQLRLYSSLPSSTTSRVGRPTFPPLLLVDKRSIGPDVTDWKNNHINEVCMVDDASNEDRGYVEFLCALHRSIKRMIESKS
eukprot:scaffold4839_cov57-Attheya_sp.AAC.2